MKRYTPEQPISSVPTRQSRSTERYGALLLGDIALVVWLSLPTLLLIELLEPGFVSNLLDITSLAIVAIFIGIVYLCTQSKTRELASFQYWYTGACIVFDSILLLVLMALQPRHLLLVLVVLVATILFSISIFFLYDRRRHH